MRASTAFWWSRPTTTSRRCAAIVEHFRAISEVSDKPIVAYNIPSRVVVNLPPATLVELAEEIPTVRAVKQANADLDQAQRIVEETDLELYAGDDNLVLPFLELGGVGGHLRPFQHRRAAAEGDGHALPRGRLRARQADRRGAGAAVRAGRRRRQPIPIKTAMNLLGHDVGGFRLPLVEATPNERERVKNCLERAGLLAAAPA